MKKILFFAVLAFLFTFNASAQFPFSDDFESYSVGDDVTTQPYYELKKASSAIVTAADGTSDGQFVTMTTDSTGATFRVLTGPIFGGLGNGVYDFSASIKTGNGKDVKLKVYGGDGHVTIIGNGVTTSTDWTTITTRFEISGLADTAVEYPVLVVYTYKIQDVYIDNITVDVAGPGGPALPTDWTGDEGINTYQEDGTVHDGSYACKVDVLTTQQNKCDLLNQVGIPVTAGETYTMKFWAYCSDHVKVRTYVVFTSADTSITKWGSYTTGSGAWEEVVKSGTVPDGITEAYVGLRFYDKDGFVAPETQYVDDVTFESPTGNSLPVSNGDFENWPAPPPSIDPPTNVVATVTDSDVTITWDAPAKGLTGYNVYRNGDSIANTTETTYTDAGVANGTYQYCVTAVYDEGESDMACADSVTVDVAPSLCVDGLYSSGCNYGDGLVYWSLEGIELNIDCDGDPYPWYHDFSDSINFPLATGLTYQLIVQPGYTNTILDVWIDFNDDLYMSEDEHIIDDYWMATTDMDTIEITIPADAAQGEHYMRYRTNWSTSGTGIGESCATASYGNMADFKCTISEGPALNPPTNVVAVADGQDVTITWEAPASSNGGGTFADDFESGTLDAWGEVVAGPSNSWEVSDTYAYEGTYGAKCTWGYDIDTWLITPPIEIGDNYVTSFAWVGSYYWEVDPNDNGDLFVKVSTDGGNTWDALWTFGDIGEWDSWTWYETTLDLSAYAGQTVLVAFNNVGNDNADVAMDNAYVGASTKSIGTFKISSTPLDLKKEAKSLPQGYAFDSKTPRGLLGYNVYRDGNLLANTADTAYVDAGVEPGTYTYCVTAVYDEGESTEACADPVEVSEGPVVIFADDFDAYTAGDKLACQNPADWTTWSNAPCGDEDAMVSDAQSHSAPNSANVVSNNDLVKLFTDADGNYYTSGKYKLSFYMYIPSGNDAYWNAMQDFDVATKAYTWGFEAYYDNGEGKVNANGTNPAATFTYSYDTWMLTELCIDLDNDNAKFSIDGNVIYEWPWSVGTSNSNLLQLAAADFYGYDQTNPCSYYIDDFMFEELPSNPPTLDPPANVMAVANGQDVTVSWSAPGNGGGGGGEGQWIRWDDGENSNAIGAGSSPFFVASHWTTDDLTDYDGQYLSKVSFYLNPNSLPTTVTVKVWQGENAGTELVSQEVTDFTGEWTEVTLDNPVMIDATQELWFGYYVTYPEGEHPAGADAGPAVAYKGDMVSFDGAEWHSLTEYGIDRNWNIAGYVVPSVNAPAAKPMTKQLVNNPVTAQFDAVETNGQNPVFNAKGLTGYNIYRDGNLIANTADTAYVDAGLDAGTYTYCVTAVYDEGESEQACADPVEVTGGGPEVIFEDGFEAYNAGEMVACQNPVDWTTWDNAPCSGTDAYVSDAYAYEGNNSANIVNDNDLVYPIADYTEGLYKISFWMYIPAGNDAYWNILQSFNDGNFQWGMQVLYNKDVEGEASVDAGGAGSATFNFSYDTWMLNEVCINLYTDEAKFKVDGQLVAEWQWSTGANGDGTLNQLGGVDFYGWNGGLNANCNYFFDNFKLEKLEYQLPDPPTNVQASVSGQDVTVTWNAPGGGSGGGEFADDFESGTFDAWGEVIAGPSNSWEVSSSYAYEGSYGAACPWGYNIDTWLITPPIEVGANTVASFAWEGSYYWEVDPNDNGDLFVKVSTDGGNTWDALWTFGDIGEWENWTWYETTVDLSAYAGQTVLVAFNNVGDDNADVAMDNAYVGAANKAIGTYKISSVPNTIEKAAKSLPQGYAYDNKSPRGLLGYNIFRNGELAAYVTETSYTDSGLPTGTYTYCVSAVYDEGESQKVCADPVTVEAPCLPPPTNLMAPETVENGNPVDLTWDAPGMEGWMHWDDGENASAIGLGSSAGTYYCASHWTPEDLMPYAGQYLTKVTFYYNYNDGESDASFVVKVWKGANAETEVVSQTVNAVDGWNEVTLDTPVSIDCGQELWFGYEVTQQFGFPAGTDAGPAVQTKGDMISFDAVSWVSMAAQYGLDYNFNIMGYAAASAKGAIAAPLVKTTVDNPVTVTPQAVETKPATPVYAPALVEPVATKGPDSYNVYRDGTLIGNTTETTYSDDTYSGEGMYQYYVTAVYPDGESDPSNTVEVNVVTGIGENEISGLNVYPNPAKDHLNITADVQINNIVVYNFAGQVIVNQDVNAQNYVLNVSNMNKGVYMLRIDTEKGATVKRIIIE